MSNPDIYRYVVAYDGGTAPNPFAGWCTLAICKPRIRKAAKVGDWIMGFRARNLGNIRTGFGHVLYAMQVEEKLTFAEYWQDERFLSRRPSSSNSGPDNIYRPIHSQSGIETLEWVSNQVHEPSAKLRDLSGQCVLVARKFWYFGAASAEENMRLPIDLLHLAPTTQGHVVSKNRQPNDIKEVEAWLKRFPPGMSAAPTKPRKPASDAVPTQ